MEEEALLTDWTRREHRQLRRELPMLPTALTSPYPVPNFLLSLLHKNIPLYLIQHTDFHASLNLYGWLGGLWWITCMYYIFMELKSRNSSLFIQTSYPAWTALWDWPAPQCVVVCGTWDLLTAKLDSLTCIRR